jgi:hypothetical protein
MPPEKRKRAEKHDSRFRAIYDRDVTWEEGLANELLTLPKGVRVKVFAYDPVMKRIDLKVKFPKGYVEPRHTHKSSHSILVTKGRMCVAGRDLRPGDYVFGWDAPHGPYEYPDGCEVFVVFIGEDTQHVWDEGDLLHHRTEWKAESVSGKKAVARGEAARRRQLQKREAEKSPLSKRVGTKKSRKG